MFLKKKFLIYAKLEIDSDEAWKTFVANESWKIWESPDTYEAIFVMSGA